VADSSAAAPATTSTKNALIIHQKSPTFGHVSKYESYFNMAPPTTSVGGHHPHPHQQHPHMTPQEKYVLYLQQRMKQQKHQQLQHLLASSRIRSYVEGIVLVRVMGLGLGMMGMQMGVLLWLVAAGQCIALCRHHRM